MKPTKYSERDVKKIDQGTKVIYKYPTPTKTMDIGRMVVNGRHPVKDDTYIIEHECQFVMYVTKGAGSVFAGQDTFEVIPGDVVFIPKETLFAVEGDFEYITIDTPAFYPEQSEEIIISQHE